MFAAAAVVFIDRQEQARLNAAARIEVSQELNSIAARLQTKLNSDVTMLQGIAAAISADPGMREDELSKLAQEVFKTPSQVKIITVAPDLVVRWIFPKQHNERVIGLDYRQDGNQRDGAMVARNEHTVVLVGPINLIQGGIGFIARVPVYITEGKAQKFWGLLSGVIDMGRLYSESGLLSTNLEISISSSFGKFSSADLFFGSAATFARDPVTAQMEMGYVRWTLAGVPKTGWYAAQDLLVFRLAIGSTYIAVVIPMFMAGVLARSRLIKIKELRERELDLISARENLEHLSLHDPLTSLPNRRFLEKLLEPAAQIQGDSKLGLIHLDLDGFKDINDSKGHAAGDQVLKETAERLKASLGPADVAVRVGGDEFVIVTRFSSFDDVESLAKKIVSDLAVPVTLGESECRIGASAGIATEGDSDSTEALLRDADLALYQAKKEGKGRVKLFTSQLRQATNEIKQLEDEVALSADRGDFVPFFQPQFDSVTLEICGVEALARWDHPYRGILSPAHFLAAAEHRGRASAIDRIILRRSLLELARWDAAGVAVPKISVNISAQRLKELAATQELARLDSANGRLCFELLESISFDEQDRDFETALRNIREAGIEIEIDDFGTGHASILSLLQLHPRRLKIDRQIVAPIVDSASQRRLVSSIIEIGRSQNIEIIGEGVETMEHAHVLRELGCHYLQGFALAKPMSSSQFQAFYKGRNFAALNFA